MSRATARKRAEHRDDLADVVRRAEAGDRTALNRLKALLPTRADPGDAELRELGAVARSLWVALAAGPSVRETDMLRGLAHTAAEIAGPGATPLEWVAAELLALAELRVRSLKYAFEMARATKKPIRLVRGLKNRIRGAERDHAAAGRLLDAFRTLMPGSRGLPGLALPAGLPPDQEQRLRELLRETRGKVRRRPRATPASDNTKPKTPPG